jgi:antitoxin component YwqK of YwqJK toxin-antitoxin module
MSVFNKFFINLLCALCLFIGTAQAQSYVEGYLTHKVTVHYPDHTVIAHVKPVANLSLDVNKMYHWFGANQINITQGGYHGKPLNGSYEDFYNNKNLRESGEFEKGLKVGEWKSWTDNGILKAQYQYSSGQKNGSYIKYDSAGKIAERGSFQHDQLNGKQEILSTDSVSTVYYKQGKVIQKKSLVPKFIYKILPKKSKKQ